MQPSFFTRVITLDFSIGEKVWLLFAIIVAIAVNAFGLGYIQQRNHEVSTTAIERASQVQRRTLDARAEYDRQIMEWKNLLIRGQDDAAYDDYLGRFNRAEARVKAAVAAIGELLDEASQASLLAKAFLKEHARLTQRYREALSTYKLIERNPQVTTDRYVQEVERVPEVLLEKLVEQARHDKENALASLERKISTDVALALGVFAVINVCGMLLALLVSRRIKRSVSELDGAITAIHEHRDLTRPIQVTTNDELAAIGTKLNNLLADFRDTLGHFATAGQQVTGAAGEVARLSRVTDEAVIRQRGETEAMVQAIGEMGGTVERVSHSAARAAGKARDADREAADGRREVLSTIDSINALAEGVEGAAGAVQRLAHSSDSIGAVLEVISGIAEQTNLLALNAAIEAARAGESGRGFAVVADEVRVLATRTHASTEEIQSMIQSLQRAATEAVEAMVGEQGRAGASVEQAARAGAFLEAITAAVSSISEMNGEIADASHDQTRVAELMNGSADAIRAAAEETAEGARATSRVSAELEGMADSLRASLLRYQY